VKRPHRAIRYRLAFDHGWAIVDEYQLHLGTPGAASRAIARRFGARGVIMSHKFVLTTLRRWRECGDPTEQGRGGSTTRRANAAERIWIKALFQRHPDLYFYEVRAKFIARWRWNISDAMISQAIHWAGEGEGDAELSLKVLERMARQRCEAQRQLFREALTGPGALPECYVIMDESSMDRRTLRRRRGWSPRGKPAKLFEVFEVQGSQKLHSLLAVVNSDGFILDACKLVEGGIHEFSLSSRAWESISPLLRCLLLTIRSSLVLPACFLRCVFLAPSPSVHGDPDRRRRRGAARLGGALPLPVPEPF
jgi:hypothetical protein